MGDLIFRVGSEPRPSTAPGLHAGNPGCGDSASNWQLHRGQPPVQLLRHLFGLAALLKGRHIVLDKLQQLGRRMASGHRLFCHQRTRRLLHIDLRAEIGHFRLRGVSTRSRTEKDPNRFCAGDSLNSAKLQTFSCFCQA